jgi:RsmE family RNA methyltransferase
LRAVARAAAMQSRRVRLPQVDEVTEFASLVADAGSAAALAQPGGDPISLARPTVLVGPEGGFSEAEAACGLPAVDLGPGVLRAETAALAAGILLCALRVGLVSAKH